MPSIMEHHYASIWHNNSNTKIIKKNNNKKKTNKNIWGGYSVQTHVNYGLFIIVHQFNIHLWIYFSFISFLDYLFT